MTYIEQEHDEDDARNDTTHNDPVVYVESDVFRASQGVSRSIAASRPTSTTMPTSPRKARRGHERKNIRAETKVEHNDRLTQTEKALDAQVVDGESEEKARHRAGRGQHRDVPRVRHLGQIHSSSATPGR